jgi:hypothetical protein
MTIQMITRTVTGTPRIQAMKYDIPIYFYGIKSTAHLAYTHLDELYKKGE